MTTNNDENIIKFAQVSDVHLHYNKDNSKSFMFEHSKDILKDVVAQINSVKDLDFTIFTGDIVDEPCKENFKAFYDIASALKRPYYVLPGNHDINENFKKNKFNYFLKKYNNCSAYDTNYYSFIHKGFAFMLLDNSMEKNRTGNGKLNKKELGWLNQELKHKKKLPILIFQHFPADKFFDIKIFKLLNLGKWWKIVKQFNNIVGVFSGHTHFSRIAQEKNMLLVSTPSLIQYPMAYRIVTLERQKEDIFVEIKNLRTKYKELIEKSKEFTYKAQERWSDEDEKAFLFLRTL